MREPSDRRRPGPRLRAVARGLGRPPSGLLARVRWLFLIFGLCTIAPLGSTVVAQSHAGWGLRLLAVVGLVSLAGWWTAAFRWGRLPLATAGAEALALLPVALAAPDPMIALGVAFLGTFYHALVAQPGQAALGAVLYVLPVATVVGLRTPGSLVSLAVQVPGLAVVAALAYLIGDTLRRQERAVARERVLSQVGAALFAAADPAAIAGIAVATALALLGRAERTQASLTELWGDELVVVAADGGGEQGMVDARLPLDAVPAPLRAGLDERRTVYAEGVDGRRPGEAAGDQAEANAVLVLPLPASDGLRGALSVTSDRPIPGEVRDALEALRAQVTLALDRAALTAELTRRASFDPLTGLANRSVLHERLREELTTATPTGGVLALLLLDLDDFKTINDSLGHSHGDEVLVVVAERLRACLRDGDLAARLGGDEFAVLLERVAGEVEAVAVAERLVESLRAPVAVSGREVLARASIGIRIAPRGSEQDPDELLRDADVAMYAAKAGGRGTARVFDGPCTPVPSSGWTSRPPCAGRSSSSSSRSATS